MSRGVGYSFTSNPVMKLGSDFNVSAYVLYIYYIPVAIQLHCKSIDYISRPLYNYSMSIYQYITYQNKQTAILTLTLNSRHQLKQNALIIPYTIGEYLRLNRVLLFPWEGPMNVKKPTIN